MLRTASSRRGANSTRSAAGFPIGFGRARGGLRRCADHAHEHVAPVEDADRPAARAEVGLEGRVPVVGRRREHARAAARWVECDLGARERRVGAVGADALLEGPHRERYRLRCGVVTAGAGSARGAERRHGRRRRALAPRTHTPARDPKASAGVRDRAASPLRYLRAWQCRRLGVIIGSSCPVVIVASAGALVLAMALVLVSDGRHVRVASRARPRLRGRRSVPGSRRRRLRRRALARLPARPAIATTPILARSPALPRHATERRISTAAATPGRVVRNEEGLPARRLRPRVHPARRLRLRPLRPLRDAERPAPLHGRLLDLRLPARLDVR